MKQLFLLTLFLTLCSCNTTPANQSSLKLLVFDCGTLHFDSIEFLGVHDHETDVRELIAPCFVIEHKQGRLLWEGGLPSNLAQIDGWQERDGGWRIKLDRTFEEQLEALNLSLSDFDYQSYSHFHFDHIGVANEVEGATLIVQRREHEAAFSDSAHVFGYSPEVYNTLRQEEQIIIDGEHDVFGDGSVRLLPAFGHTPGHQELYLDLPLTGPVILAGDLYVFRVGREQRQVLPIDVDSSQSLESMQRLEAFVRETGSDLWIGHDMSLYDQDTTAADVVLIR